jgi:hypothetical protein
LLKSDPMHTRLGEIGKAALAPLALLVATACAGYQPGSFHGLHGARYTVGCLDVEVAPHSDPLAEGPAVTIAFGNRCDAATVVDLRAIRATARYSDGFRAPMAPRDPAGVIRPGTLDARLTGREILEYQPLAHHPAQPVELCLDLAAMDASEPSPVPVVTCVPALSPVILASAEVRP